MTESNVFTKVGARALRTRWLVRAPIWLYRCGLGFLFGSRLLMLQHTGRRTGTPRYVVLEVIDRPATDEYVIVSGFGTKSQWYRNVLADPQIRLSTGTKHNIAATATPMTDHESTLALEHYAHNHPKAWNKLRATIEHATGSPVTTLPMVLLRTN
ncbi:nitroreductase family deazaflavin-dependent oxidoreductase [Nocardia vinacea]|uniref:Nitroreductase family deazaflavin-dependent oxidoreductase n=1 Tax=Nocardia vinacea TaxID=96468 RepID=A0ABZ1YNZ6_9NOCA|nr:nitroreductase family deazaflavin-dependent oxidoreductase [Nocardia vinacea]